MWKRLFVTAVLCVGLMAIQFPKEVEAGPRIAGGGIRLGGSLYCDAFLTGVGNPDINPVDVECTLSNTYMQVQCMNNGGGIGGLGIVFDEDGQTSAIVPITWDDFTSNGKAAADVYFSDCVFYDAVADVTDICINPNWSIIPPAECNPDPGAELDGTFTVLETDVTITSILEDDSYYRLILHCTLDIDNSDYLCSEEAKGRCNDPTCSNIN
jgi:hypothetical protein